ncbi:helix-turn-helix domain-containing protein [Sphingomonas cavernae]|uniref:AraC family transcriptional regulator n=1 Tax=Sphingomonas cavernae TaxID=2320861 RepID=A0A418WQR3_9SPHN|nr:AraC family transcriptional regulator [Sphingomonas cavernae]RJF93590.1 AraC family transcriptional regulator [Sphingomonas cavernae]
MSTGSAGYVGVARYGAANNMARHQHAAPYVALVLQGGYVEAGDIGRVRVHPGDMLIHGRFEAHQDHFAPGNTHVLNLPMTGAIGSRVGRVADADAIVVLAERDVGAATALALDSFQPADNALFDWPDLLAGALREDRVTNLAEWAEQTGIARTSLSRGFALAYGVSPQRYRAEVRARRAAEAVIDSAQPLAAIAIDFGFSDQAHMTRAVAQLTGLPPATLRRRGRAGHVTSVQDGCDAAD